MTHVGSEIIIKEINDFVHNLLGSDTHTKSLGIRINDLRITISLHKQDDGLLELYLLDENDLECLQKNIPREEAIRVTTEHVQNVVCKLTFPRNQSSFLKMYSEKNID